MSEVDINVSNLRAALNNNGIDALIITGTDPHQSEYIAPRWNDREWLSGFSGSAGSIVVTKDFAGLWTDSRYFIQAEAQLKNSPFELMKQDPRVSFPFVAWCKNNLSNNATIAVDGFDLSLSQYHSFTKYLGINQKLKTDIDLIDLIWKNRPPLPYNRVFSLDLSFCGQSIAEKLSKIKTFLNENNLDFYLFTALDEIAWLLNLRGSDVDFNPIFISYLLAEKDSFKLFIDGKKLSKEIFAVLEDHNIEVLPYENLIGHLNSMEESLTIGLDAAMTAYSITKSCNSKTKEVSSPIQLAKSIKNNIEITNTRNAMAHDGAALANAFFWLEEKLPIDDISEYDFSCKLTLERSKMPNLVGDSFPPIVGFNGNGAIIHYRPTLKESTIIKDQGILLVDSGGQYRDGTTDITRTIALGSPSEEQKEAFTLVLKGMIALSGAIFPTGTSGIHLDILARQYLWQKNMNYGHGTGHGVGFFLNVHEGPQSIAGVYSNRTKTPLEIGMITSNEPGYYAPGQFGIRTENLILCMKKEIDNDFLCFETLSLYPFDAALIDITRLSPEEITWINRYHQTTFERISPLLTENVRTWFRLKCKPIG